mgnify:CR=1 FL=1
MATHKKQVSEETKTAIAKMRGLKINKQAVVKKREKKKKKQLDAIRQQTDLANDWPIPLE